MPRVRSIQSDHAATARTTRHKLYSTSEHRRWRNQILHQADYTCAICGDTANIADHYPLTLQDLTRLGRDPWPIDGGRALCPRCSGTQDGGRS